MEPQQSRPGRQHEPPRAQVKSVCNGQYFMRAMIGYHPHICGREHLSYASTAIKKRERARGTSAIATLSAGCKGSVILSVYRLKMWPSTAATFDSRINGDGLHGSLCTNSSNTAVDGRMPSLRTRSEARARTTTTHARMTHGTMTSSTSALLTSTLSPSFPPVVWMLLCFLSLLVCVGFCFVCVR